MDGTSILNGNQLLYIILLVLGGMFVLALLLLIVVFRQVRRINLPPDADIWTALQATPFIVVLLLDMLDFSLDFLSAPLAWIILSRLGLKPLRGVTVIESLIPGTQLLPTMTVAWIIARFGGERLVSRLSQLNE